MRPTSIAWVHLFLVGAAIAEPLTGSVSLAGNTLKIGDSRVAPGDARIELALRRFVGQQVRVDGEARTLRAFLVTRILEPRQVERPAVVLQDHKRPGKHLLYNRPHAYRPLPGSLADLLARIDTREVDFEAWVRNAADTIRPDLPGETELTGIKARVVGGEVWIRDVQGDQAVIEPVAGGPRRTAPLAGLEIGKAGGERRRVKGVVTWDVSREECVILSAGRVYLVQQERHSGAMSFMPPFEGLEVDVEGLAIEEPVSDARPPIDLVIERTWSPVRRIAKARGVLGKGLALRTEHGQVQLRSAAGRELRHESEHGRKLRLRRASLIPILQGLPLGSQVEVRGAFLSDGKGRMTHLLVWDITAVDKLGREWRVEGVEDGKYAVGTDTLESIASDLKFDLRGLAGRLEAR